MSELLFLKLGGSVITDKSRRETPRLDVIHRIAAEVARALAGRDDLSLVIGHGSGSYGHFAAQQYGVHLGNLRDWHGYAATSAAAARLNRLVADGFLCAGVPIVSLQPSASARCVAGELVRLASGPVRFLLGKGLVPLVYGDVAWDTEMGCTIVSTEHVFAYLARRLRPKRIVMVGEVHGVFTADPRRDSPAVRLPLISPRNISDVRKMLGGSAGVDVTGGMLSKVMTLCDLIKEQRDLVAQFVSGEQPEMVEKVLRGQAADEGTIMQW